MSITGFNWLNTDNEKIAGLKPTTLCILTCLVRFHRDEVGCIVSQIRIARRANVSKSTVNTHLDTLERLGLIARERGGLAKPNVATRYHLPFEDSFEQIQRASAAVDKPVDNLSVFCESTGPISAQSSVQFLETVINTHLDDTNALKNLEPRVIEHCLAVCGPGLCSRSRQLIRTSDHVVTGWLAAGYSLEQDILPVLRRRTARFRRNPIETWDYFKKAVPEAHTRRLERERRSLGKSGATRDSNDD